MELINLIGQRFGKLLVTAMERRDEQKDTQKIFWQCKCDCGKETVVRGFSLRSGDTTSCGCIRLQSRRESRKQILTGLRYGRLSVGAQSKRTNAKGKNTFYYECVCDCGNTKSVQASHLRCGSTKSCGCLQKEMLPSTKYLPNWHFLLKSYQHNARSRKLEFALTDKEFIELTESNCHYCNAVPARVCTPPDRAVQVDYAYNGIDRLDSDKGYISGNVVACCTRCNYAKRNYSQEDFIEMCQLVAEKHPRAQTTKA